MGLKQYDFFIDSRTEWHCKLVMSMDKDFQGKDKWQNNGLI